MSIVLLEDFRYIRDHFKKWQALRDSTILITGATGFLGSLLAKLLDFVNKAYHLNIRIIVLVRHQKIARKILRGCDINYLVADLSWIPDITEGIDYIFHCAAVTKSKIMIEKPLEVIRGIVNGTQNILELAHQKNIKSMVYLSSMEVYGATDQSLSFVNEDDLGYIDILNVRNCYPHAKRMAENICYCYFKEYSLPVKIARLAQTFGAGILETENRVFFQFLISAIHGKNIVLHTDGSSLGNYCYSADTILGLLLLLTSGENGQIYNISNEDATMTIKEMAEIVALQIAKGKISIEFDISKDNIYGYAMPSKMKLSSKKMQDLGWNPMFGIKDMYQRMADDILMSSRKLQSNDRMFQDGSCDLAH